MGNKAINYFVEEEIYLCKNLVDICLLYLDRQIYNLDSKDILFYKNKKKINWHHLCKKKKMSIDFMDMFIDKLDWSSISRYQKLNLFLIDRYINKIDFHNLSKGHLTMEIIKKYENKLNWKTISKYGKFDEDIIVKYFDKIRWKWVYNKNKNISRILINKYKNYIDDFYLETDSDYW